MEQSVSVQNKHFFRVDKFIVPQDARAEFISRVEMTHNLLRTLPGFMRDIVLEQASGPGEFNFVTLVEWESEDAIENARSAVASLHEQAGFNPQELFHRAGIKADLALYRNLDFSDLNNG